MKNGTITGVKPTMENHATTIGSKRTSDWLLRSILAFAMFCESSCWFKKFSDKYNYDCDSPDKTADKYFEEESHRNDTDDTMSYHHTYTREKTVEVSGGLDIEFAKAAVSDTDTITVSYTVDAKIRVGKTLKVKTWVRGWRYECEAWLKYPTEEELHLGKTHYTIWNPKKLMGSYETD